MFSSMKSTILGKVKKNQMQKNVGSFNVLFLEVQIP
jgi:hypothetical protein